MNTAPESTRIANKAVQTTAPVLIGVLSLGVTVSFVLLSEVPIIANEVG